MLDPSYTELKEPDLWEHRQVVERCVAECRQAWPRASARALALTRNPFTPRPRKQSTLVIALAGAVLAWAGLALSWWATTPP